MPLSFEPADTYRIAYQLRGIVGLDRGGEAIFAENHSVLLTLGAGYPREKPMAVMESQIFHPNMRRGEQGEICFGDYWSPALGLSDVIVTIGEMIQYQRYNVKSPLNGAAAEWAEKHEELFPVGNVNLYLGDIEITLGDSIFERES